MTRRPFIVSEHARWGDVDLAGIVRFDAYTRFCEIGEAELFRAAGFPLRDLYSEMWLPRKVVHTEFMAPALLDDRLRVESYVTSVGRSSLTINFDIWSDDRRTLHAMAYQVLVCVGRESFAKRELPEELRKGLEPWMMSLEDARAAS